MPLKPPRSGTRRSRKTSWDRRDTRFAWRYLVAGILLILVAILPDGSAVAYNRHCELPEVQQSLHGHLVASLRCASPSTFLAAHWWIFGLGVFMVVGTMTMLILLRWMPEKERIRRQRAFGPE
jgi:drug/metabolite transporter (DMT)-like permease